MFGGWANPSAWRQIYLLQVLVTSGTGSQQMVSYLVKIADTFVFEAY